MQQTSATPSPLSWDDVRLFLALSRSRTLGEAGRRVGMDSSTMSRRLDQLEEALAALLFERGRNGISATEAAERLMPAAEEMEHVMARFTGEAEAFEREVAGRVRLACPADAAEVLIAPLLPELLARHPRLRIDLDASERIIDMARREADLALRTQRPDAGDLIVTRLLSVGWSIAACPALARRVGTVKHWAEVPWISCTERFAKSTPGRWASAHLSATEAVLRSDSLTVQMTAAANGVGAALVPNRSLEHYQLVPLKLAESLREQVLPLPKDDLFLVTHRALRAVPRVRAVWTFLREKADAQEACEPSA